MTAQPIRKDKPRFCAFEVKPRSDGLRASDIETILLHLHTPNRVLSQLARLLPGLDPHLCGHGLSVAVHGYLSMDGGRWTLLWPSALPVVGEDAVALDLVRLARSVEADR